MNEIKGENMGMFGERIAFLDYLRIVACFMVMIVHAVEPFYFDGAMNLHWMKTLSVALPLFLVGLAVMAGGFFLRIPGGGYYPVHESYAAAVDLEMSIEYCSLGVAAATVAIFLVARKFTADGLFYRRIVVPASKASYGAYLVHIFMLSPVAAALKGTTPMPVCVAVTASVTFVLSMLASCVLRKIPFVGKCLAG